MLRCPKCNHILQPGDSFCRHCGASAPQDAHRSSLHKGVGDKEGEPFESIPLPIDSKASFSTRDTEKKRSRRVRFVTLGAAAVVVLLCAGIVCGLCLNGVAPTSVQVIAADAASEGEDEPASLSRSGRLMPKAVDGGDLKQYTVRVSGALAPSGEEIDVSKSGEVVVQNGSGFLIDDVIGECPDGSYTFSLTNVNGSTIELPSVDIGEQGISKEETEIATKEDAEEWSAIGSNGRYYEKIAELEAQSGEPYIRVQEIEGGFRSCAAGLACAKMVDFGDGVECLLTVELTVPSTQYYAEQPLRDLYAMKLWKYNPKTDGVECILGESDDIHLGEVTAVVNMNIYPHPDGSALLLTVYEDGYGVHEEKVWGLLENGSIGLVHKFSQTGATGGPAEHYFVDDAEVSGQDYENCWRDVFGTYTVDSMYGYNLAYPYYSYEDAEAGESPAPVGENMVYYFPADCIRITGETKAQLESA